jgi:glycosyltransferase involved in cell wall biosynthesis
MRIVLAYNVLDSVSGEATFFDNMASGLSSRGLDVSTCPVHQAPIRSLLGKFEYYSRYPLIRNTELALRCYQDHDIVHFLNASMSPCASRLRNKVKIATTHFTHPSYTELSPPAGPLARVAETAYCGFVSSVDAPAFRSLDRIVACSDYQRDDLIRRYGIDPKRAITIHPGVDLGYFRSLPRRDIRTRFGCGRTILFLGRLHERSKGLSFLIHAMSAIKSEGAKLIVIGDGPDREYYERLVARLDLGGKVVFLGKLGYAEKSSIQRSADLIVMPSLYEVFGTVFAEALACGVPVIAYDMPFWKGIYTGAGMKVDMGRSGALPEAIDAVLGDPSTAKRMIDSGSRVVEKHSFDNTLDSYVALYESLTLDQGRTS